MLPEAKLTDLLQASAKAIYKEFYETLRLIKETTDPAIRKMWSEDLADLHSRAQKLLDTELLNHLTRPMMKIVVSRPCAEWVILARNGHSPHIVVR